MERWGDEMNHASNTLIHNTMIGNKDETTGRIVDNCQLNHVRTKHGPNTTRTRRGSGAKELDSFILIMITIHCNYAVP